MSFTFTTLITRNKIKSTVSMLLGCHISAVSISGMGAVLFILFFWFKNYSCTLVSVDDLAPQT